MLEGLKLRYLNGSLKKKFKSTWETQGKDDFEDFMDIDYAENEDTRKSLSGFVFTLFETIICWEKINNILTFYLQLKKSTFP